LCPKVNRSVDIYITESITPGVSAYLFEPGSPLLPIYSPFRYASLEALANEFNCGLDHFNDIPGIDLGESFIPAPKSDVPVLILSGTLDGRTYTEIQKEAVRGLSNATIITVENAGHNLFMSSPEVTQVIQKFMSEKAVQHNHIKIDLVK